MIRYLEHSNQCDIVIDSEFQQNDIDLLHNLFKKKYEYYEINIYGLYLLWSSLIKLLCRYMSKRNIHIISDRGRLVRYLHKFHINAACAPCVSAEVHKNIYADVLLIGGSAKSSKKIIKLLLKIDVSKHIIIIVQHLSARFEARLDKLLFNHIGVPVSYAKDGEFLRKGSIYIAPKQRHLKVEDGYVLLDNGLKVNDAKPSISVSFESFSAYYKQRLCVVLECGYAQDGIDILRFLRANNSTVVIQDPSECYEAISMPKSAIENKEYDYILTLDKMGDFLYMASREFTFDEWLEYLLEKVYEVYEYDYRDYDRNMIRRRAKLFMIKHSIKDMQQLTFFVLYNKIAFRLFFLETSINVSEFFRNSASYRKMLDILLLLKRNYNIKIWCAGVSNGKEAYSFAILLDILGISDKSLIYATDFNPIVIEEAKNALYSIEDYEIAKKNFKGLGIENKSIDDYFILYNSFMEVDESIKNRVMFFVHNLQNSSSFNEFDIIECRNVLIYFNEDLQEKVFALLYDSLKFGGYLFLGLNEFLIDSYADKFEEYDSKLKIFKKVK